MVFSQIAINSLIQSPFLSFYLRCLKYISRAKNSFERIKVNTIDEWLNQRIPELNIAWADVKSNSYCLGETME